MTNFNKFIMCAVSVLAIHVSANADTILLGSYGTSAANPGVANTATFYSPAPSVVNNGSTATFNISPGSTWHPTLPNSSYVSYNPNTGPGGSFVTPNGSYFYTTSFILNTTTPASQQGTLTVLADDTVAISLNNHLILAAAAPLGSGNSYAHCSDTVPNCLTPTTFNFSGLVTGTNQLTFEVKQVNLASEGLDFSGSISAIPEPSSLAFLGTGMLSLVGMVRRQMSL